MRQRLLSCFACLVSALMLLGLVGCKADQCSQMVTCCQAVKDVKGVGQSCGGLAEKTRDPQTCRDIKRTVRYMMEDRKVAVPAACMD